MNKNLHGTSAVSLGSVDGIESERNIPSVLDLPWASLLPERSAVERPASLVVQKPKLDKPDLSCFRMHRHPSQASLPYFLAGRCIGLTPVCSSAVYGAP